MTATLDELEHLLADVVPACECVYTKHVEPPPAAWVIHWVCACTPTFVLACTGCKDALLSLPPHRVVYCPGCGSNYRPPQSAVRLTEPLTRRPS